MRLEHAFWGERGGLRSTVSSMRALPRAVATALGVAVIIAGMFALIESYTAEEVYWLLVGLVLCAVGWLIVPT